MTEIHRHNFGDSAVIVARVSTPQQTESPQLEDLREYAKGLGFQNIKEFGTTESGFLEMDDKQGWNLVVDFFETHPEYKTLVCTELSRLSRVKSTLMLIEEYLVKNKIQLIVKDINFFLFNEYGVVTAGADMIFTLYASFASSEMSNKRERFKRALKEYRKLGYSIGGKVLFGYNREYVKVPHRTKPQSKYFINEKEKEEILTIYKWYAFGIDGDLSKTSVRTITQKCIEEGMSKYLHSKRNVTKCLKEQAYTGFKETHNRIKNPEYWNYHKYDKPKYLPAESYLCLYPPIFEGEDAYLFDYVQSRMQENNSKISNGIPIIKERKHTTILSKLLVCPNCGRYLHGEYRVKDGRQHFTYRCAFSRGAVHKCSFTTTISMRMIDSIIWQFCKIEVRKIKVEESEIQSEVESKEIQKKILNLQSKIDEYDGRFETEEVVFRTNMIKEKSKEKREIIISDYEKKVASLNKEREHLEKRQEELRIELAEVESRKDINEYIKANLHKTNYTKAEISKYVHRIVKSIDILYNDTNYTVLKVNTPNYLIDNGYVCIFKRRTLFIEACGLYRIGIKPEYAIGEDACPVLWDKERNVFTQGTRQVTLQEVYDFAFNDKRDINMMIWTHRIQYDKLDCYDEDVRERL